jgi:dsRNA-specific ribonuclease
MSDKTYWRDLAQFLGDLLSKILGSSEKTKVTIKKMLQGKNEKLWIQSFTHFTYDQDENYERAEFIGDTFCKPSFCLYLTQAYDEDFTEKQLTELYNVYMAKMEQEKIARKMKLDLYLRVNENNQSNTARLLTDLFESFVGTLYYTAENAKLGLGFVCCRALMSYIFGEDGLNYPIDLKYGEGSGKSVLIQITSLLGIGQVEEKVYEYKDGVEVKIYLSEDQIEDLEEHGKKLPKGAKIVNGKVLIGEGKGNTKKKALNIAYEKAYYDFVRDKMDITMSWVEQVRSERDLNAPGISKYKDELIKKASEQGISTLRFVIPGKLSNTRTAFIQLVGVRREKPYTLASDTADARDKSNGYEDVKIHLVKEYLRK